MNFLDLSYDFVTNIGLILRNEKKASDKIAYISLYSKFMLKYLFLEKCLRIKLKKEKLFGRTIRFFDYSTFRYLFNEIFVNKNYLFKTNNDRPRIIDCGSNIGMSILFFKTVYPKSNILGFEPDDATFKMLKRNVEENQLRNVELVNAAVSDKKGKAAFYASAKEQGSLIMSLLKERSIGAKMKSEVPVTALSEHITGPVDFLKLDVEGAENAVIEELSKKKKLKLIKEMLIEYHHNPAIAQKRKLSKLLDTLEKNKFNYCVSGQLRPPYAKEKFQDIAIYAFSD